MAKKKGISKVELLNAQLHEANELLAAKAVKASRLQAQLEEAQQQVQQLQQDVDTNQRLESNERLLASEQREASTTFNQYENQVLMLELQSLVERYRIMDVETISEQNHELREEVMRLQAENMELSKALAASGQRARQDVAKIHLALEAAARDTLASARERLCRELHDQLDDRLKLLVEEHGTLQESTMVLSEQAAELDRQYRHLVTDRRQYKVDAEIGNSMQDMQNRQIVLLKHQLERMALTVQMLQVKCEEQVNRAEAADGRATAAAHTAARLQAQVAHLKRSQQLGAPGEDTSQVDLDDADLDDELVKLRDQVSAAQRKADQSRAACEQWKRKAQMYERSCAQLQVALQALQQFPVGSSLMPQSNSGPALKAIWSSEPQKSDTSPSNRITPDPSGVLGDHSCFSSMTPRDGQLTPPYNQDSTTSQADMIAGSMYEGQHSQLTVHTRLSSVDQQTDDRSKVQDQTLDVHTPATSEYASTCGQLSVRGTGSRPPRLMSARPGASSTASSSCGKALRPASAVTHSLGVMPHTLAQSRMARAWSANRFKRPMSAAQGGVVVPPSQDAAVVHGGNESPRPGLGVQGLTVSRLHKPCTPSVQAHHHSQYQAGGGTTASSAQAVSGGDAQGGAHAGMPSRVVYQPQVRTTAAAAFLQTLGSPAPANTISRPKTALQPRSLRPGSSRYFSAVSRDPFLTMFDSSH